jgi:hypothetical protein
MMGKIMENAKENQRRKQTGVKKGFFSLVAGICFNL